MPDPPSTDLPRPKSWEELEDICNDVLKILWKDPYVVRHGRSGQKQGGVDIYGQPVHLGGSSSGKYAGAQCKNTDHLTLVHITGEVEKAKSFQPTLAEYVIMTTAPRDAGLQEAVRVASWPFPVKVLFWEDISLCLSGHDDLLQKHFPGWMKKATTKERVLKMVASADPGDFDYDDNTDVFFYTCDVALRLVLDRGSESEMPFDEPWVHKFPDQHATRQPLYIYYGETRVHEQMCVYVDGGRHVIPIPKSRNNLTIDSFQYHIGCILNHHIPGDGFTHIANKLIHRLECPGAA